MKLAASLLICVACAIAGYVAGDHQRDTAWRVRQATAERDAGVRLRAEIARGEQASRAYATDFGDLTTRYATLQAQFHALTPRIPLALHLAPARPVQPAASRTTGPVASGPPPSAVVATEAAGQAPTLVPGVAEVDSDRAAGDLVLSAGAVWMWNSALVGTDVPAGACSTADTSESACAAGTTISLVDAWRNHARNAQSCAEDRLRYQRLIDFLQSR